MFRVKRFDIGFAAIFALWSRHCYVYAKTWHINCIPPISEPIVYFISFGYGFSPLIGSLTYGGREVPYMHFIAPGMIAVGVLFQSFVEGAYGSFVRIKYRKTWQTSMTAPLTFTDVFLAEWLWAATKGVIAGIATAAIAILFDAFSLKDLMLVFPFILLGSLLFAGLGLLATGLIRSIDQINIPLFLLVVPMFALSGTYFPREVLPVGLKTFADLLPLATLVDLLRTPISVPENSLMQLLLLTAWTFLLTALAWHTIRAKLFR